MSGPDQHRGARKMSDGDSGHRRLICFPLRSTRGHDRIGATMAIGLATTPRGPKDCAPQEGVPE